MVSGVSWKDALLATLPKRKIFSAKGEEISLDDEDSLNGQLKEEENKCPTVEANDNSTQQNN